MKLNEFAIDQIQLYLAIGVLLHPTLRTKFDVMLYELEIKEKVSLLPSTTLKMYNEKLLKRKRIA